MKNDSTDLRFRKVLKRLHFAMAIAVCALAGPRLVAEPVPTEMPEQFEARMAPWRDARFGMFIHWGPVSLKGTEIGWSRGKEVPIEEYDNLYKQFNPVKFDADVWVSIAKAAGMKYVVLTTKHHDGFCLWDTQQNDYNIMNTPFKRDVTRELADACRKQGLAFGTYYSTCDWRHPDFPLTSPGGRTTRETHDIDRYTEYLKAQTAELVKNYGPLFTVWFDVPQKFSPERGQGVIDHLRAIQPGLVINDRTGAPGDYDTPEQKIGGFKMSRPWETCMTLGGQWAWKPNDQLKSLKQCLQTLLYTIGGDGNLLFNVGPSPEGEIEVRQVERLKEMGAWIAKHSASIYGTRGGPFKPGIWGVSTRSGNRITLFIIEWPADGRLVLPVISAQIQTAATIDGKKVSVENNADGLTIIAPPLKERDPIATAIILTLDSPAMAIAPVRKGGVSLTVGKSVRTSAVNAGKAAKTDDETIWISPENATDRAHDAGKAVDGDEETNWTTEEGIKAAWLEVDLGEEQLVSEAIIDEGKHSWIRRFAIEVKEGDVWKAVVSGTKPTLHSTHFPAPVKGRYFRLVIQEVSSQHVSLYGFDLYR